MYLFILFYEMLVDRVDAANRFDSDIVKYYQRRRVSIDCWKFSVLILRLPLLPLQSVRIQPRKHVGTDWYLPSTRDIPSHMVFQVPDGGRH